MRPALTDQDKAKSLQTSRHLAGLQHRHAGHRLDHLERLYSDEFRSHLGLAIFEEHGDHLFKVFA